MVNTNAADRSTCDAEPFPNWVINYVIALSAYAESRDLPEFELKTAQATETLLKELNAKQLVSENFIRSNIVSFCEY